MHGTQNYNTSQRERLLTTPFAVDYADESITLSALRTRWEWDSLRNNPRFQKIVAGALAEKNSASTLQPFNASTF
jgi:hypothetical protein